MESEKITTFFSFERRTTAIPVSEPSASNFRTNSSWLKKFIISHFDHDVEFLLSKGNAEYKGAKGSLLQKSACAMYDYKAYPTKSHGSTWQSFW